MTFDPRKTRPFNPAPPSRGFVLLWARTVGDPELGVWCDRCLLPSAATVRFELFADDRRVGGGSASECGDCGRRW